MIFQVYNFKPSTHCFNSEEEGNNIEVLYSVLGIKESEKLEEKTRLTLDVDFFTGILKVVLNCQFN